MSMAKSSRARGPNRGGCGGGYERTDPDYDDKRLARLKRDYAECPPEWREQFLAGLTRFEADAVARSFKDADKRKAKR